MIPVSSRVAMIGTHRRIPQVEFVERATQRLVKDLNHRTINSAERFLYYHAPADWVRATGWKEHLLNVIVWDKPGCSGRQ